MKRKSKQDSKTRILTVADLRPPTDADLKRIRAAAKPLGFLSPHIQEMLAKAMARGVPPQKPRELIGGRIRLAVVREMNRREWTSYALWKRARRTCPTLPQSAVYEFLAGTRAIGLEYVEAILNALDLRVTPARSRGRAA
jgi:hypothetical protein